MPPIVTLPNGQAYDLGTYDGRQAARDGNPGYVVTADGYLLRGSGGESPGTPNPGIQGGSGTQSPSGYPATLPPIKISNDALNQVQAQAAAGTIASGPGGSYIFPIAQLVSAGVSLREAEHRVIAAVQSGLTDLSASGTGAVGGSGNPGGPLPLQTGLTKSSSSTALLVGGGLLLLLLLGKRH